MLGKRGRQFFYPEKTLKHSFILAISSLDPVDGISFFTLFSPNHFCFRQRFTPRAKRQALMVPVDVKAKKCDRFEGLKCCCVKKKTEECKGVEDPLQPEAFGKDVQGNARLADSLFLEKKSVHIDIVTSRELHKIRA